MEKKVFTMMLLLLTMTAVVVSGCGSDETPADQTPENKNVQTSASDSISDSEKGASGEDETVDGRFLRSLGVSGCKSAANSRKESGDSDTSIEAIMYEATKDSCLIVYHENVRFSCESTPTAKVTVNGNVITIVENCADSGADCICPYDLTMVIGSLQYQQYEVYVCLGSKDYERAHFTVDYNSEVKGEFIITKK